MIPSKSVFACFLFRKTIDDISIKMNAQKINQNDPISNIVPNKDTSEFPELFPENRAERKNTRTTPSPDTNSQDFGKTIRPERNRAITQKIMERASPTTKSNPLEVSAGMMVKGRQKIGDNTSTKNKDKNESLSNKLECMRLIIHYFNLETQYPLWITGKIFFAPRY